jgi:hypothetical protein
MRLGIELFVTSGIIEEIYWAYEISSNCSRYHPSSLARQIHTYNRT